MISSLNFNITIATSYSPCFMCCKPESRSKCLIKLVMMNSGTCNCQLLCLLSAIMMMLTLVSTSNPHPPRSLSIYELIYITDGVITELTGSITMICRSDATAEKIPLSEVKFWLNGTANSTSLRERTDINVLEVDKYSIRFNLTRNLEGLYTCGKCIDEDCEMSSQKQLICKCIQYCMYYYS